MERILNPTKIYDIDLIDNKYIITNSNTNVDELIDISFELYPNKSYKFNLNKNINNLIKLDSYYSNLYIKCPCLKIILFYNFIIYMYII